MKQTKEQNKCISCDKKFTDNHRPSLSGFCSSCSSRFSNTGSVNYTANLKQVAITLKKRYEKGFADGKKKICDMKINTFNDGYKQGFADAEKDKFATAKKTYELGYSTALKEVENIIDNEKRKYKCVCDERECVVCGIFRELKSKLAELQGDKT
jgi:hypothetical protein